MSQNGPEPTEAPAAERALAEIVCAHLLAGRQLVLDGLLEVGTTERLPSAASSGDGRVDTQELSVELTAELENSARGEGSGEPAGKPASADPDPGAAEKGRMAVANLKRSIREELKRGQLASLAGVLDLRLVPGETLVQDDAKTGRRLISAGPLEVAAAPSTPPADSGLPDSNVPDWRPQLGSRRFFVQLLPEFAAELEREQKPILFVILPEPDFFFESLEMHFTRRGWHVQFESEPAGVASLMDRAAVACVVVDQRLDPSQVLARATKAYPSSGPVPLVILAENEDRPPPGFGLRVLGDATLVQPYEFGDLIGAVSQQLSRGDLRGSDVRTELHLEVETTAHALEVACDYVCELFGRIGLDEEALIAASAAYREVLANAARHGNKGDASKHVDVRYTLTHDTITVTITDEGEGFDHQAMVTDATTPGVLERVRERVLDGYIGGLGLMLISRCVDELVYSKRGNSVTMVKRVR